MEQIIAFLEQYWGYSIVGGITIGTIITFIVTAIKMFISNKSKDSQLGTALKTVSELKEKLNNKSEENTKIITAMVQEQNINKEKEKYFQQVQAVTFKALSYLILASKLPNEEKIALQQQFTDLSKVKLEEYKSTVSNLIETVKPVVEQTTAIVTPVVEQVMTTVKSEIVEDAIDTIATAAQSIPTLLDKYTKEE